MKKILSLILMLACALTCTFALASCDDPVDPAPAYTEVAASFITAYNAITFNNRVTDIKVTTELGVLNSGYALVKNDDGTTTLAYAFEKVNGLDATEDKETIRGVITSDTNGNFASDPDGVTTKFGATGVKLDIDNAAITDYEVSANVLRITVKQAVTAAVLGASLPSDTSVVVTLKGTAVDSITLNYDDAAGNAVEIVTVFNVDLTVAE